MILNADLWEVNTVLETHWEADYENTCILISRPGPSQALLYKHLRHYYAPYPAEGRALP